jgi:hypothetical protein
MLMKYKSALLKALRQKDGIELKQRAANPQLAEGSFNSALHLQT